jgi:hypothetical protein
MNNADALTIGSIDLGVFGTYNGITGPRNANGQGSIAQGSVSLQSSGTISESGSGAILANTLNLTGNGAVTLGNVNQVLHFTGNQTASGDFALVDDLSAFQGQPLVIDQSGIHLANSSNFTLDVRHVSVTFNGGVSVPNGNILLRVPNGQVSGLGNLTASGLALDVNGSVDLEGNSDVNTLAIRAGGDVKFTSNKSLTIGTVRTSVESLSGITAAGRVDLEAVQNFTIQAPISANGNVTLFARNGDITEQVDSTNSQEIGTIQGNKLYVRSGGSALLTEANKIMELANATVSGSSFSFVNGQTLQVDSVTNAGSVSIRTTAGDLFVDGAINDGSTGTISLTSAGAIDENSGATIFGLTLNLDSVGIVSLNGTNGIQQLSAIVGQGNFGFTNGSTLTVIGPGIITANGSITLAVQNGNLNLNGDLRSGQSGSYQSTHKGVYTSENRD